MPYVSHALPIPQGGTHAIHGRRSKNRSIKTITPPPELALDNATLFDHITSLQKWALVGRWYFSKMGDSKMRNWVKRNGNRCLGTC